MNLFRKLFPKRPNPVMLIPVDLDCNAVIGHAVHHGQWVAARGGVRPQMETFIFDKGIDQAVFLAVKQAADAYVKEFPALQATRDERYRIMLYEEGQEFPVHVDQNSVERQSTRVVSVIIYLNDDFTGGRTVFPNTNESFKPKAAHALLLPACYAFPHASTPVTKGTKWVAVTHLHIGPPWLIEEA